MIWRLSTTSLLLDSKIPVSNKFGRQNCSFQRWGILLLFVFERQERSNKRREEHIKNTIGHTWQSCAKGAFELSEDRPTNLLDERLLFRVWKQKEANFDLFFVVPSSRDLNYHGFGNEYFSIHCVGAPHGSLRAGLLWSFGDRSRGWRPPRSVSEEQHRNGVLNCAALQKACICTLPDYSYPILSYISST